MSTEEPHTEAPTEPAPPQAAASAEPPPSAPIAATAPQGPSTNVILIVVGAIALVVLGGFYLTRNGDLFHGSQTSAVNYTIAPFTPQTELVTASEHVMAHAQPDIASPGVVMFGQGVTLVVNGRVSRGLGDDWYAVTWNNQRAFVRVADTAAGSGAPPTPAEHQVQQPREVKPDESDEPIVADNDLPSIPDEPQSSGGRELRNVDWIRAPSARDFARYYPDRALEQGQSGRVVLDCTAQANGRLNCSVSEENPRGYRFGEAALGISRQVRLQPTQSDGRSVAGGHLTLPLNFRAN